LQTGMHTGRHTDRHVWTPYYCTFCSGIGVKFCILSHIGPGRCLFPFGGGTAKGSRKSKILPL